jgi:hypothetical protein
VGAGNQKNFKSSLSVKMFRIEHVPSFLMNRTVNWRLCDSMDPIPSAADASIDPLAGFP